MSDIQKCPNLVRGGGSAFFKNALHLKSFLGKIFVFGPKFWELKNCFEPKSFIKHKFVFD